MVFLRFFIEFFKGKSETPLRQTDHKFQNSAFMDAPKNEK
jgi:hypothetical protein